MSDGIDVKALLDDQISSEKVPPRPFEEDSVREDSARDIGLSAPDGSTILLDDSFVSRDWITVVIAIALAILWFSIFELSMLDYLSVDGQVVPGLGVTVFTVALFAGVFISLGKRTRIDRVTVSLLVAVLLMALVPAVFSNPYLRVLNCVLLLGASILEIFLLADMLHSAWDRLSALFESIRLFISSLLHSNTKPLRALNALGTKGNSGAKSGALGVLAGVLIALVVLAVVLPLLSSADAVFGSFFNGFAQWLEQLNPWESLWHIIRVLLLAPFIFALLYNVSKHRRLENADNPLLGSLPHARNITLSTALIVLDIVYLLFVAVQLQFLFGGAEASSMSGGYAAYAREGFFQLVAVAAINLLALLATLVMADAKDTKGMRVMRVLSLVLLFCTVIILVSACMRMLLYISVFGFSLLRALTLLGMVFIAICLVAAGIKVFRPKFVFFRVFLVSGLVLWICFNFCNIDARIAEYNVEGFLNGTIEQIDVDYLGSLSPGAIPALENLAEQDPQRRELAESYIHLYESRADSVCRRWQSWNLSYAMVK
ncbi:MAG: DUF4173 domain-containing protein [Actinobacteria bacterium]|nr:DUF4173 domain-containing protein [Actinomycetota bacterium]